jgi:hypothetical protein
LPPRWVDVGDSGAELARRQRAHSALGRRRRSCVVAKVVWSLHRGIVPARRQGRARIYVAPKAQSSRGGGLLAQRLEERRWPKLGRSGGGTTLDERLEKMRCCAVGWVAI